MTPADKPENIGGMGKKKGSMGKKKGGGGNSHQRAVAETVPPTAAPMSLAVPDAEAGLPLRTFGLAYLAGKAFFVGKFSACLFPAFFSPAGSAC